MIRDAAGEMAEIVTVFETLIPMRHGIHQKLGFLGVVITKPYNR